MLERILAATGRDPSAPDLVSTQGDSGKPPLAILERDFGDLTFMVGSRVLDFGCGIGRQTEALAALGAEAVGYDLDARWICEATRRAPRVEFSTVIRPGWARSFDYVITQNAMEHFRDPAAALREMRTLLRDNGEVLVTFGPPWLAPWGAHQHFWCPIPWVHLLFPEATVMRARSRYRNDGYATYEEAGLNRLTVRAFEKIVEQSAFTLEHRRYLSAKGLGALLPIPFLRELAINRVVARLRAA
jgi:SAM-dependent methyltransferase